MRTGGYLIVDLKDNELVATFTLEGLYKALKGNPRKVILLSGINISDDLYNDAFVTATLNASDEYEISVYGYKITIDENDLVSATQ